MTIGRFRAQSIPELIDSAFSLYRRNFPLLVAIAALVQVPFALLKVVLTLVLDVGGRLQNVQDISRQTNADNPLGQAQRDALLSDVGALIAFFVVGVLVSVLIVVPLSEAATVRAVSDRYLDRPASIGGSFRAGLRRIVPLLAALVIEIGAAIAAVALVVLLAFLVGSSAGLAIVVVGAIGLLVGALVLFVRWSLAPQVIVVEGVSGLRGLRRSWALTRRRFWRTLGFRLLLGLITGIVSLVVGLVFSLPFGGLGGQTQQTISQAGSAIIGVFIAPLTLIGVTLYYYDQRIRREAFDIEMVAATL